MVAEDVIVAEDESILRTQLEGKLAKLWPELEIIAPVSTITYPANATTA